MWKLIENIEVAESLVQGQVIATVEDDRFEKYELRSILPKGYITALHSEGKRQMKVFPVHELLFKWWAEIGG